MVVVFVCVCGGVVTIFAYLSQLIWIHTVCEGRAYPGSAGTGLTHKVLARTRGRVFRGGCKRTPLWGKLLPNHAVFFYPKLTLHS